MIYNAVHCATKVRLIDGEPDPTLLDFAEVTGDPLRQSSDQSRMIMGNTKLAAFLRDLAQCLDDEHLTGTSSAR